MVLIRCLCWSVFQSRPGFCIPIKATDWSFLPTTHGKVSTLLYSLLGHTFGVGHRPPSSATKNPAGSDPAGFLYQGTDDGR